VGITQIANRHALHPWLKKSLYLSVSSSVKYSFSRRYRRLLIVSATLLGHKTTTNRMKINIRTLFVEGRDSVTQPLWRIPLEGKLSISTLTFHLALNGLLNRKSICIWGNKLTALRTSISSIVKLRG
jgi:hypothetical protein